MREENALVIVFSRNYSTGLSVIRSLGAAGYTVDLVASSDKKGNSAIAASSKYVRNSVEVVSEKIKWDTGNELVSELLKYAGKCEEKPVLFPTDDYTTSVVDLHRNVLQEHFIMPSIVGGGEGSLTAFMDKTFQARIAQKAGLRTPEEWIISLREEIVIPEDMVYPCFCKPIESISGYKKEMVVCDRKEELHRHLAELRERYADRSILVQECLEIDQEIDISGVCLDQEIIIPAIIKKTNVAQYERGVTLSGKVLPFAELGEIQSKIINMLKEFHYVGMFDMELNIVGNNIYFNEVNLRSGGPNYSYFMSGVNLPELFVKEVLGQRHTPEEEQITEYGKCLIYEKVAWEDYIHGFMTKKELNERLEAADIKLLHNDNDPAPGILFDKEMNRAAGKAKLRAIKRSVHTALNNVRPYIYGYPQTKKKNRRDPNSQKPRVLVSGRNYCSNLCMARSLGRAGYEVEILHIFQVRPKNLIKKQTPPDAYSKYVKAYYICVSNRSSERIVRELLSIADPERKMLLIPADDLVANVADEYLKELSEFYFLPNIDEKPGEISRLMSKNTQKYLAKAAGLPVINSCVIRTEQGQFSIPETVEYPCFIKPNISKNASKSRIRKCESKEELRKALTEFSQKKDIEMLVEDYVEIGKEYSLLGLSTKEGVVSPGFFVVEEGGHGPCRGVAVKGRMLPCSQQQKLIEDISNFVGTLNYEGLFDVDLIETTDGKMYFVELNLRFGGSGYAVTESGVNLPGMFADYMLLNKPIQTDAVVTPGKIFLSEKVMLEEYKNGFLSLLEVKKHMAEADIHFVKDEQDMRPYRHFKILCAAAALGSIPYFV